MVFKKKNDLIFESVTDKSLPKEDKLIKRFTTRELNISPILYPTLGVVYNTFFESMFLDF